jgi:hypothetical protein
MNTTVSVNRDERQRQVQQWAIKAFGRAEATSMEQRAIRLLEETLEACQACNVSPVMAKTLVDYVFNRPVGELRQELGGIGVTLLALSHAAGFSADVAERNEIARCLSRPIEDFTERNKAKNAAGFLSKEFGR